MKPPKELMKYFRDNFEHGDIVKIHKEKKISRPTVMNALKNGRMHPSTFTKMVEYLKEKKAEEAELTKNTIQEIEQTKP